ncbi:MAG: hypothetical protein FJ135_15690 [Deltaproteobacteria bacterium]|nr:hypothetical protein [Deltaproteobacteria bacterium]
MGIIDLIKTRRGQQKDKKFYQPPVFAQVAGIIKKFQLDQKFFLDTTDSVDSTRCGNPARTEPVFLSLFPLLTEAQYQLTLAIIEKYNNPYLSYARSPGELKISRQLYQRHPHLTAETLQQHSWEHLVVAESHVTAPGESPAGSG